MLQNLDLKDIQAEGMKTQMQHLLGEKAQLMEVLHNGSNVRTGKFDMNSSCSTMSLVHLQYKYEELLANHNGLLKLLEMRMNDIRKLQDENVGLKKEIQHFRVILQEKDEQIVKILDKLMTVKEKKNAKISRLYRERNTLRLVHNQLTYLLHKQCMERNNFLNAQIKNTSNADKAQLLQEIQKNNVLVFENFRQQQEIDYLRSMLNIPQKNRESYDKVNLIDQCNS